MKYSKKIVVSIIVLNCLFSVGVLYVGLRTSFEPTALVGGWFSFTTIELWNLASIKKKEVEKERKNDDEY